MPMYFSIYFALHKEGESKKENWQIFFFLDETKAFRRVICSTVIISSAVAVSEIQWETSALCTTTILSVRATVIISHKEERGAFHGGNQWLLLQGITLICDNRSYWKTARQVARKIRRSATESATNLCVKILISDVNVENFAIRATFALTHI